jgi:hypothetical protein
MLLYPDIFELDSFDVTLEQDTELRNDGGQEKLRSIESELLDDSYIASSFLSFQATGIQTTCRLNKDVTNILCNIVPDFLAWDPNIPMTVFADLERGKKLMNSLTFLKKETGDPLYLVSPEWINKIWVG